METYEFMKSTAEPANKLHSVYFLWAKQRGVSYNELSVLYTVYNNGSCSQKRIRDEWFLPKQTVHSVCKELSKSGVIVLEQSDSDKRETNVTLTEKGKALAEPIVKELLAVEDRVLKSMGDERAKLFLSLYEEFASCIENEFIGGESS